jgi:hypothetical protein
MKMPIITSSAFVATARLTPERQRADEVMNYKHRIPIKIVSRLVKTVVNPPRRAG